MAPARDGRRYHLIERLGTGAHGEVYLAEQESPGGFRRRVALKVLRGSLTGRAMREAARRMRDEARLLGLLDHRNIVRVLDLVRLDDGWAVVMDPVPGVDLERLLQASPAGLPARPVLELAAQVAATLDAAHAATDGEGRPLGVIHRDIKPANLVLTADGDPKVLDFGIARMNLALREGTTGPLVGTLRYMSPERVRRAPDTPACDVYALGATVVELLLGEPLGPSPLDPDPHLVFVARAVDRVRCRLLATGCPVAAPVVALLGRTLDANPARRPAAGDLARSLAALALQIDAPDLRSFARTAVPPAQARARAVAGGLAEVLVEDTTGGGSSLGSSGPPEPAHAPRSVTRASETRWVLPIAALALAALLGGTGVAALAGLAGLVYALGGPDAVADREVARPDPGDAGPTEEAAPPVPVPAGLAPVPPAADDPPGAPDPPEGDAADEPVAPAPEEVPDDAAAIVVPDPDPAPVDAPPVLPDAGEGEAPRPVPVVAAPMPAPIPAPAPAPAPAPPPPSRPDLRGTWTGIAAGSPMTLRIAAGEGDEVEATAEITQGTTVRSTALAGGWHGDRLVLEGAGGTRFEAVLVEGALTGTWVARPRARPQAWSASRR